MPKLPEQALRHYREQGYCAPIRAMPAEEAGRIRAALEAFEAANPDRRGPLRNKSHLVFTWADQVIRHPGILDAVESVIGPNILCWGSSFFIKNAHDPSFVSWHQDSTYWGLEPPDIVTAWVAISESVVANGAMRVIPGTHKLDQVSHRDTFAENNLLSRGQEVAVEV
ncbi:MAG: phytanoyl-CoA dioxygenase family protein, partial [Acidisphaera sp.]|nr:phytanoyl-CoA dioxygenase family protein [Acidisphaera sp.]